MVLHSYLFLFVVLIVGCSATDASCDPSTGVCEADQVEQSDSSLIQKRMPPSMLAEDDVCQVGDLVRCPGSNGMCVGTQCCDRHPDTNKTFPCPSAPADFHDCESPDKIKDCVAVKAEATCAIGEHMRCPEGNAFCDGHQCCPRHSTTNKTYPCPSAAPGLDSCESHVKIEDCTGFDGGRRMSTRLGSRDTVPTSIYFAPIDRFARSDGNMTPCATDNTWCNGTIRGLIDHLDYIQGMGFEAVWITPVVKQYPGTTPSGTGCMGYWAQDLYEIDPHFGTKADMKELVQDLHRRGMVIVYDFVANHMGPIHNTDMVRAMNPFNRPENYHQLFRGDMTFDEYVHKDTNWPPPAQAMWSQSGAQCTQGAECTCWVCKKTDDLGILGETGTEGGCEGGEMVFKEDSPCPKGALSKYCMPGDYQCKGYNETITQQGWFFDLGDLNQTNPFVRRTERSWLKWFVKEYDIDYLRLDTAAFMDFDFLSELQASAGVSIMGEVTTTNLTYHAQFQSDPPSPDGKDVLDGVLNFPLQFSAAAGFCGEWWPYSYWNLTFLGERMMEQQAAPYRSLERLGNFIDNHDGPRVTAICHKDKQRIRNSLVWVMLNKGTPIIYYGTEQYLNVSRESLWQTGYDTTAEGYRFLKKLNEIRAGIPATASLKVIPTRDHGTLVFSRGDEADSITMVFLNNLPDSTTDRNIRVYAEFCEVPLPLLKPGYEFFDAMTDKPWSPGDACITGTEPLIIQARPVDWKPSSEEQEAVQPAHIKE